MAGLEVLRDPGFGMGRILGTQAIGRKEKASPGHIPSNCNTDKKAPVAEYWIKYRSKIGVF